MRKKLTHADFTGVLYGERLAEAYAKVEVFVFPSRTDTFGNVVLEALSSGVPAIVSDARGPKFIVRHGKTGFVACKQGDFTQFVVDLMNHPEKRQSMSLAAREYALGQSWDAVFACLYRKSGQMLASYFTTSQELPTVRPDRSTAEAAQCRGGAGVSAEEASMRTMHITNSWSEMSGGIATFYRALMIV